MEQNKALEIVDGEAPFLTPMPSDNEQLIRTAVEFSLELSTPQIAVLSKLEGLCLDLKEIAEHDQEEKVKNHAALEAKKLRMLIDDYKKGKRFFKAKEFVGDLIASISWFTFAQNGQQQGNVNKSIMSQ